MAPEDAHALGLLEGSHALCRSDGGEVDVRVRLCDTMPRGVVSLPHAYGLEHPAPDGKRRATGAKVNVLTKAGYRDPLTAVPFRKHVRVSVVPIAGDRTDLPS